MTAVQPRDAFPRGQRNVAGGEPGGPEPAPLVLPGSPGRGALGYALDRARGYLARKRFDLGVRGLRDLAPVRLAGEGVCVLSMLCHRDLWQYLVAIRSLATHLAVSRVVVVNDGSLNRRDVALLHRQVPAVEVRSAAEFSAPGLPGYSSWRRLEAVVAHLQDGYVVQMDADTIARAPLDEVARCVAEGRGFILPTRSGRSFVPAAEARAFGERSYQEGHRHVQCLCERGLDAFPEYPDMKYVRGCAGFAGYPKGSVRPSDLRRVSDAFGAALGAAWPVWGSEQVTNNLLIANLENATVLPIDHYDSVDRFHEGLRFVHFIGYFRFDRGIYLREARRVLAGVPSSPQETASW